VELIDPEILTGFRLAVTPEGLVTVRSTVPENPFTPVIVIVENPEPPAVTVIAAGLADKAKSATATVTLTT